jgi:MFS transporter, PAT family, solute carrier family 33 (acetyl-CoA transportor), member 1
MPLYLASNDASWKQQGILSFIMYPFSAKLLWAPLLDVVYIRRLGRRQTWLLPILILLGIMFIVLSFNFESLLAQVRVTELTIIFFFIILFTTTQDICVDGWALSLFSSSNTVWQSITQMIGQPLGSFLGSSILLTFESSKMSNLLVRQPLGMALQSYGLFTLGQFIRFWGIMFLVVACIVAIFFHMQRHSSNSSYNDYDRVEFKLVDTYFYIIKLFKKKCFRQATLILIGPHMGYAATSAMTLVMLIR